MIAIFTAVGQVKDKIYTLSKTQCPVDSFSLSNVTKDTGSMISKGFFEV